VNLAVLGRDVEHADRLSRPRAIGIGTHDNRRAGFEIVLLEAIDERLRDGEAFTLDELPLAVLADRLDDQVDMRVLPFEPCDRPFDQDLLGHVEHGHAVVREHGCDKEGGCGKPRDCGRQTSHGRTSGQ